MILKSVFLNIQTSHNALGWRLVLNRFREHFQGSFQRVAGLFIRLGLKPYMVSALSVISALISSLFIYFSGGSTQFVAMAILFFGLAALTDAVDGAMARMQHRVSKAGSFMDSFSDRIVEVLILCSVILTGMVSTFIGLLFLCSSLLISYIRSKAEAIDVEMAGIGLMERAERILLVIVGLILWLVERGTLEVVFLGGSALNIITLIQRLYWVAKVSRDSKVSIGPK